MAYFENVKQACSSLSEQKMKQHAVQSQKPFRATVQKTAMANSCLFMSIMGEKYIQVGSYILKPPRIWQGASKALIFLTDSFVV